MVVFVVADLVSFVAPLRVRLTPRVREETGETVGRSTGCLGGRPRLRGYWGAEI